MKGNETEADMAGTVQIKNVTSGEKAIQNQNGKKRFVERW